MAQLLDRATLALAATLEQFDRPLAAPHPNVRYVGPVLDEESPSWEPPGRSLVLVSFSTTYMRQETALRRALEAVGSLDVHAVCTLGNVLGRETLHASANVQILDWMPHGAILPYAAAVVTHAGHSTVMAALADGVPLVCMPMGRDQHTLGGFQRLNRLLPSDKHRVCFVGKNNQFAQRQQRNSLVG